MDKYYKIYNKHVSDILSLLSEKDIAYLYNYIEQNGIQAVFQYYAKSPFCIADNLLYLKKGEKKKALSHVYHYDRVLSLYIALLKAQFAIGKIKDYNIVQHKIESLEPDLKCFDVFPCIASDFFYNTCVRIAFWPFENHPAPKLSLNLK